MEAINTARLQSMMPDNMFAGAVSRNSGSRDTSRTGAEEKAQGPKGQKGPKISRAFMDAVNHDMQAMHNVGLEFSVHGKTGETVIKVIDYDTGKLIRQIPPQDLLDLAARLEEMMGILFDKQV